MGFVTFDRPRRRPGEAVLRFVVASLTSLLVVALAGLIVVEVRPAWLAGLRNAVPAPAPVVTPPSAPAGRTAATGRHATTPPHAPSRAGADVAGGAAGHGPRLVALRPASGTPGQHLTVAGVNLFSANGRIELRIGGRAAPVRCTSTHSCVATVPRLGGPPRTMQVALRTTSGRSNTLAFHYR